MKTQILNIRARDIQESVDEQVDGAKHEVGSDILPHEHMWVEYESWIVSVSGIGRRMRFHFFK